MQQELPPHADEGAARVMRWDAMLGVAAFLLIVGIGALVMIAERLPTLLATLSAAALIGLSFRRTRRTGVRWVRALADRFAVANPEPLSHPWVIDGDTLSDHASGRVYRLANIDAPETGDGAKCFRERRLGEAAKWAAVGALRRAKTVTVRRTLRRDRYGRIVAYVFVDGVDLGELLLAKGLARRWHGWRPAWCGPNGALAQLAAARGECWTCKTCRNWR